MKMSETIRNRFVPGLMALSLVTIGSVALSSCSNDDDDITPSQEYVTALKKLYPTASKVDWEKKGAYVVAEFRNTQNHDTDVWFDGSANWAMTTTDYDRDITQIPDEVLAGFSTTEYYGWVIDDAAYVERRDADYYVIGVEKQGSPDTDLVFSPDGTFKRAFPGEIRNLTPETVLE